PAGRVSADMEWGNAAVLTRGRQHLVAGTESETASWGGGWFTDLIARVNVRLAEQTSLAVAYGRRGEGWWFALRAYTDERCRHVAGLPYARYPAAAPGASGAGGAPRHGRRLPHGARSATA